MTNLLLRAACCCDQEPPVLEVCEVASVPSGCYPDLPSSLLVDSVGSVRLDTGGTQGIADVSWNFTAVTTKQSNGFNPCTWEARQDQTSQPDPPLIFGSFVIDYEDQEPRTFSIEAIPAFPNPLRDDIVVIGCDTDVDPPVRPLQVTLWGVDESTGGSGRLLMIIESEAPTYRDPREPMTWSVITASISGTTDDILMESAEVVIS